MFIFTHIIIWIWNLTRESLELNLFFPSPRTCWTWVFCGGEPSDFSGQRGESACKRHSAAQIREKSKQSECKARFNTYLAVGGLLLHLYLGRGHPKGQRIKLYSNRTKGRFFCLSRVVRALVSMVVGIETQRHA